MCVWSLVWKDPLEKEMAVCSSILAWRGLWTEEPGGLQSIGSQRVRQDWSDLAPRHPHKGGQISYFSQSTHSNANLIWKHPHRHTHKLCLIWLLSDPVKVTHNYLSYYSTELTTLSFIQPSLFSVWSHPFGWNTNSLVLPLTISFSSFNVQWKRHSEPQRGDLDHLVKVA